jgi:hypothetical protein
MKIAYINRLDFNNPGDAWSTPYHYIGKPGMLMDLFNPVDVSNFDCLVVGGGAILQNSRMVDNLEKIIFSFSGNKVFWGGGISKNDKVDKILKEFDLLGCRDYAYGYNYIPCASAMHQSLRKTKVSNKDFLIIDHWKRNIIDINRPVTRLINRFISADTIIEEINNHNFLITSSYHAAYWGILLKKKVIVISMPMQEKFNFKYKIPISDAWDDSFLDNVTVYNDAFDESYNLNLEFKNQFNSIV